MRPFIADQGNVQSETRTFTLRGIALMPSCLGYAAVMGVPVTAYSEK